MNKAMIYKIINATTVSGNGRSYQLSNRFDAEDLCDRLNDYEKKLAKINEISKR